MRRNNAQLEKEADRMAAFYAEPEDRKPQLPEQIESAALKAKEPDAVNVEPFLNR